MCVLCFISDICFSIFYVCNWHDRLWTVGIVCWNGVSSVLAVGEPRPRKPRERIHSYRRSSLLLIYSSLEYRCTDISICDVRMHSSLLCYCTFYFYNNHNNPLLMALFLGLPGWASTRKVKPIWIYWSKRQWVAVVSAGPYANLHLP